MRIGSSPGALRVYKIATAPEQVLEYLNEFDLEMPPRTEIKDDLSGEKAFIE